MYRQVTDIKGVKLGINPVFLAICDKVFSRFADTASWDQLWWAQEYLC